MTMVRAIVIPVDDDIREVQVDALDFRSLANAIGSEYIELVRCTDPAHYLIVDETGLLTGKTINRRASLLYPGPTGLRGDVLVVGWDETATYSDDEDASEIVATTMPVEEVSSWISQHTV